jgi:hypothetical protein
LHASCKRDLGQAASIRGVFRSIMWEEVARLARWLEDGGATADHGPQGSGEPLAFLLRPGNAGSNTASEHIEAARLALAQLPESVRRRVLIRADSGGGTHDFLAWLRRPGRCLQYSVGMAITDDIQAAILAIPKQAWDPGL